LFLGIIFSVEFCGEQIKYFADKQDSNQQQLNIKIFRPNFSEHILKSSVFFYAHFYIAAKLKKQRLNLFFGG